jgi:spore germination protein
VVQGPKESFSEGLRTNTALLRRRVRDPKLKVKQVKVGQRGQTDLALMYIDGIVRPAVLQAVEARIADISIDAVLDSGSLEQLIEESWLSPFPQGQLTERPDKAASAVLEGRIAIIVDNSPFALIVPVTLNCFFQSSEDYYNRWQIMSLTRLIRFAAALMAVALPGLYIAVANFHPSMIPMLMATKLAAASQNVPFPAIIEILLMDAAFELLREAGVRLPGAVGGTMGIVGGLIIGQAAVEAGVVSPIVVIIVALTGVAAFAIPHVSLVYGFRLIKYGVLILSAFLGFFGFWAALLLVLTHTAGLRSFGVPYLMPFAAGALNRNAEIKDSLFRFPLFMLKKRPFFARRDQQTRQKEASHAVTQP